MRWYNPLFRTVHFLKCKSLETWLLCVSSLPVLFLFIQFSNSLNLLSSIIFSVLSLTPIFFLFWSTSAASSLPSTMHPSDYILALSAILLLTTVSHVAAVRCKCTKESETVTCTDGVCETENGCKLRERGNSPMCCPCFHINWLNLFLRPNFRYIYVQVKMREQEEKREKWSNQTDDEIIYWRVL